MHLLHPGFKKPKHRDFKDLRDLRDFKDLRDLRDFRDLRDLRDFKDAQIWILILLILKLKKVFG